MHSGVKGAPPRAATSRKWLQIDAQGKLAYVNVDKHTLVLRLNIPYRDLRSLESTVRQSVQHGFLTSAKAYNSPSGCRAGCQCIPGRHPGARESLCCQPGSYQDDSHAGPGAAASLSAPAPASPGCLSDGLAAATRRCTLATQSPALAVAARCSLGAIAGARAERARAWAPAESARRGSGRPGAGGAARRRRRAAPGQHAQRLPQPRVAVCARPGRAPAAGRDGDVGQARSMKRSMKRTLDKARLLPWLQTADLGPLWISMRMYIMRLQSNQVLVPCCGLQLHVTAAHGAGACRTRHAAELACAPTNADMASARVCSGTSATCTSTAGCRMSCWPWRPPSPPARAAWRPKRTTSRWRTAGSLKECLSTTLQQRWTASVV